MLTVQIGQCGNQLGRALFQKLAQEEEEDGTPPHTTNGDTRSTFFRSSPSSSSSSSSSCGSRVARAVLIDMEPKVIQRCVRPATSTSTSTTTTTTTTTTTGPSSATGSASTSIASTASATAWRYDPRNTFTQQSGSGNNWAFGYMVHGAQHEDALLELLRSEAERCDRVQGFLTLQSVAGGTGSGLGSFLTERLADAFPAATLLNAVVWPHGAGEVIVQNYNALLTMASLCGVADGVLVLPNDTARAICQRLLRLPRPSFDAMNDVMATHLAAAFLPVQPHGGSAVDRDPTTALCRQLCSHPGFKLLDIKTIPQMPPRSKQFSTHTWSGVLKHLHQMQIANAPLEEGIDWHISLDNAQGRAYNRALGAMLVLRGRDAPTAAADATTAFRHPAMYASWSLEPFACYATTREFHAYDKSATLISNSKALLPTLVGSVDKAYDMFSHGAYTHQYARHGVDEAFFQEAFLRMDQVVHNYQSL